MTIPFNKSEYNRLLILSYLYGDHIPKPSYDCPDDVKLLYKTLDEFPQRTINCDNAGTVLRFMLSVVAAKRQPYPIVITGSERMLERPIEPLVSILQLLGADISYIGKNGFPPVIVNGSVIPDGVSEIFFNDVVSSQFVSSIMMIAPVFTHGLIIHYKNIPSFEYVRMTSEMMNIFGLKNEITKNEIKVWHVGNEVKIKESILERDWSSAAYIYPILLIDNKLQPVIKELHNNSMQGDEMIVSIAEMFGIVSENTNDGIVLHYDKSRIVCERNINVINVPDLTPAIATLASLQDGRTNISGMKNLKWKESDRLACIVSNLSRVGIEIQVNSNDSITIISEDTISKIRNIDSQTTVSSSNDHRIAMSLYPFTLLNPNILIDDLKCISKSFPNFIGEISTFFNTFAV
ncbi:MAG: hypothetical protein IKT02_03005 [Bacteroidales bacterium]|nr:hypothetical protein [Bacteroidales bacterium]